MPDSDPIDDAEKAKNMRLGPEKCVFIYNANKNRFSRNRFEGCEVGVHFTGNADLASGYLNNGATGTATGVGIKIYNASSQHVHLGQALPASSFVTPAGDGSVTLRHHAALVQTADTIVDGSINAVATIVVQHQ